MVHKRGSGCRNAGSAAAKSSATRVAQEGSENSETQQLGFIPADPEDARLTVNGAKVLEDGKIDISAYEDLMSCWAGEPSPGDHPHPEHPGVRANEPIPKGLRIWDDLRAGAEKKDGAGWIAVRCSKRDGKKEKWFNIRTCGSWRLAFLLARLQRSLWERSSLENFEDKDELGEDGFEKLGKLSKSSVKNKQTRVPRRGFGAQTVGGEVDHDSGVSEPPSGSVEDTRNDDTMQTENEIDQATTPTRNALAQGNAEQQVSTPESRRPRPQEVETSTKKRGRAGPLGDQALQKNKKPRQAAPQKKLPAQANVPLIGADVIASSSRLQQILAARRLQEEKGQQP
eukprot:TRINITY_DN2137_c0_g1_i2.p1 TRINITY_DN2137_c0_g1~~TRINITY_DN2137_c0_g1_i2.p1  ORF type:complete len:362 (-),score=68.04 TRINITY_DN2137_c0_g1_i2:310-1332(-)